jgi:hypothetical protein
VWLASHWTSVPFLGPAHTPPRSRAAGVTAAAIAVNLLTLKPTIPAEVCTATEKAGPSSKPIDQGGGRKLRHDKLDGKGTVTLRINHQMDHAPAAVGSLAYVSAFSSRVLTSRSWASRVSLCDI